MLESRFLLLPVCWGCDLAAAHLMARHGRHVASGGVCMLVLAGSREFRLVTLYIVCVGWLFLTLLALVSGLDDWLMTTTLRPSGESRVSMLAG